MPPPGLIAAVMFLILAVTVMASIVARIWRGDARTERKLAQAFAGFPFGPDVQRGMVRGILVLAFQMALTLAAVVTAAIGMAAWHGGSKFTPLMMLAMLFLVGAMVSFAVQLSIIWLNRPRHLVPPHLRDEVGVRAGRRGT